MKIKQKKPISSNHVIIDKKLSYKQLQKIQKSVSCAMTFYNINLMLEACIYTHSGHQG
jgi:hypothetical protein